jgi:hypothetical protein
MQYLEEPNSFRFSIVLNGTRCKMVVERAISYINFALL